MSQFYKADFIHSAVAGSLMAYDLPDLSASLAPRKLIIAGITDCMGHVVIPDSIQEDIKSLKQLTSTGMPLISCGSFPEKQTGKRITRL